MLVTFEDDFLDLPTHNLRIFVCTARDSFNFGKLSSAYTIIIIATTTYSQN